MRSCSRPPSSCRVEAGRRHLPPSQSGREVCAGLVQPGKRRNFTFPIELPGGVTTVPGEPRLSPETTVRERRGATNDTSEPVMGGGRISAATNKQSCRSALRRCLASPACAGCMAIAPTPFAYAVPTKLNPSFRRARTTRAPPVTAGAAGQRQSTRRDHAAIRPDGTALVPKAALIDMPLPEFHRDKIRHGTVGADAGDEWIRDARRAAGRWFFGLLGQKTA